MLKGFKAFIMRGNVIDLAVAVIIGAAFNQVVNSMVGDVLTPLIGAIFGRPDFSGIVLGPVFSGQVYQRPGKFSDCLGHYLFCHRRADEESPGKVGKKESS
jgi:large conductance mechanosensitive channel protein